MGENHDPSDATFLDKVLGHGTNTDESAGKVGQKRSWLFGKTKPDVSKSCPIYKDVFG